LFSRPLDLHLCYVSLLCHGGQHLGQLLVARACSSLDGLDRLLGEVITFLGLLLVASLQCGHRATHWGAGAVASPSSEELIILDHFPPGVGIIIITLVEQLMMNVRVFTVQCLLYYRREKKVKRDVKDTPVLSLLTVGGMPTIE